MRVIIAWEENRTKQKNGMQHAVALFYKYNVKDYKFKQEGIYIKTEPRDRYTFWDVERE